MIKLYHGDCLAALPNIPNGLVDMVVVHEKYFNLSNERINKELNSEHNTTS